MIFCRLPTFFQNLPLKKILSGTLSECQTVGIQVTCDILLDMIWDQTVCKDQLQMAKFAAGRQS